MGFLDLYLPDAIIRETFDTLRTPSIPQIPPMGSGALTLLLMAGQILKDNSLSTQSEDSP